MNILVTGSSGFIGGWLVRHLKRQGHVVYGIDIRAPRFADDVDRHYGCDILDRELLRAVLAETSPDAVVHLAARVDLNETRDLTGYAVNIDGVTNLVDAVKQTPSVRRAIYTSSQLVCRVGYVPKSDTDYCPNTLYGESKVLTERIVRSSAGGGVEWCLARPTTVWGPYMSKQYQTFLKLVSKGLYFHTGRRKLHKSYSYAANIAHQYAKLLQAPAEHVQGRTFYLCDYEPLSLRDYADGLAEELGARRIPTIPLGAARLLALFGDILNRAGIPSPFTSFRLRNILTEYIFDTSATEAVCGPLPVPAREGIKATAKWYLQERALERNR